MKRSIVQIESKTKYGFKDEKGNWMIQLQFTFIDPFNNSRFAKAQINRRMENY